MSHDTVLFIAGVLTLLTTRIVIDIRHIRDAKHRRARNIGDPTISYIIELKRSADTILPLLDHLGEVSDGRAEVVILVYHTAGPRAQVQLQGYRRRHTDIRLRIVRRHKGMDMERLIRQYTRGTALMQIDTDTRLSRRFGRAAETAFSDLTVSFAVPYQHVPLDRRITTGIQAGIGQWRHLARQLFDAPTAHGFTKGILYRKTHLLRPTKHPRTQYMTNAAVLSTVNSPFTDDTPETAVSQSFRFGAPLAVIAFVAAFATIELRALDLTYLVGLYGAGYVVSQFGMRHYSAIDHLNLLLISPFVLVVQPVVIARRTIHATYRKLRDAQLWRSLFIAAK